MKKPIIILFNLFLFGFGATAQVSVQEVIDTEKSFAQLALTQNTQAAFLAYMSDNSLLEKQGKLVKGRPLYLNMPPDTAGKLIWTPTIATISASGDLGYTSGPYKYQLKGKAVAYGDFATVWEKQADGQWKFVIDLGNSHAPSETQWKENEVKTVLPAKNSSHKYENVDLIKIDQDLAAKIQPGSPTGYQDVLHPAARLLRTGQQPYASAEAKKSLFSEKAILQFTPEGYKLAAAQDLGVVYGSCAVTNQQTDKKVSQTGVYMHVWRKDAEKGWQLLHESISVHAPKLPAEKKESN